ncbi:MAG: DUF1127 domain-containing protein [Pseudomonadota bacterium]
MATNWTLTIPGRHVSVTDRVLAAIGQALLWYGRARERRALAELDDHLLRDIGVSRAEADREAGKPFWQV